MHDDRVIDASSADVSNFLAFLLFKHRVIFQYFLLDIKVSQMPIQRIVYLVGRKPQRSKLSAPGQKYPASLRWGSKLVKTSQNCPLVPIPPVQWLTGSHLDFVDYFCCCMVWTEKISRLVSLLLLLLLLLHRPR